MKALWLLALAVLVGCVTPPPTAKVDNRVIIVPPARPTVQPNVVIRPQVVAPRPVVVTPSPVIIEPAPVVITPAPVIVTPPHHDPPHHDRDDNDHHDRDNHDNDGGRHEPHKPDKH